jgi:hypothetical protein
METKKRDKKKLNKYVVLEFFHKKKQYKIFFFEHCVFFFCGQHTSIYFFLKYAFLKIFFMKKAHFKKLK